MSDVDAIAQLAEWEAAFPVDSWTLGDVHVWPVVRITVGFKVLAVEQGWPARRTRPTARRRAADALRAALARLHDARRTVRAVRAADCVFLSYPTNRQLLGSTWYDRYCDPLADILEAHGRTSVELEYRRDGTSYRVPRHRASLLVRGAVRRADRARMLGGRIDGTALAGYTDLVREVARRFAGSKVPVRIPRVEGLSRSVRWIEGIARRFDRILAAARPRVVVCSCYYSYPGLALCLAARRRGIPAVDLQHGVTLRNPAYEGWSRFPPGGYEMLPSLFWTWTERDRRPVAGWPEAVRERHPAVVGGNPWAAYWDSERADAAGLRRRVDAMRGGAQDVLVALSWSSGLGEVHRGILRRSPPDWTWWIRLHPSMEHERSAIRAWCASNVTARVHVDEATDLPLPLLLRAADVHLTQNSTVVQEATAAGVPSVALDPRALAMFRDDADAGWMVLAGDPEQALAAIRRQSERRALLPRSGAYPPARTTAETLLALVGLPREARSA